MATTLVISVEDKSVPEIELDTAPNELNTVGIDLGLEKLYVDSFDNQAKPQKHLRKAESKLAKLQRKLEDNNRWHDCKNCGLSIDRDYNSALLIKKLAVGNSQDKKLPSLAGLLG